MKHNQGTPKTLLSAIQNAQGHDKHYNHEMLVHIRDYLAQHFSVAAIRAHKKPLTESDVLELFVRLTKE